MCKKEVADLEGILKDILDDLDFIVKYIMMEDIDYKSLQKDIKLMVKILEEILEIIKADG